MLHDTLLRFLPIFAIEWSAAVQAFVQNDADAPPVAAAIVGLPEYDLWSHVLTRSYNASRQLSAFVSVPPVEETFTTSTFFGVGFRLRLSNAIEELVFFLRINFFYNVLLISRDLDSQFLHEALTLVSVVGLAMRPVSIECKAKVRDFEMTGSADEKVVRLDIPMDPLHLVGFFDAQDHLGHVLLGDLFLQHIFSQKQPQEVSTDHIFHHQI